MTAGGGAILEEWVRSRGVPYGREPSVKVFRGIALTDRFLLTLSRQDLGPRPGEDLLQLARLLRMPPSLESDLVLECGRCDIVHLGFEGGYRGSTFKFYFERVRGLREVIAGWKPEDPPIVIHRALKWATTGEDDSAATAEYTCQPSLSLDSLHGRMASLLPSPPVASLAVELLARAAGRVGREELLFMEVEEPGSPRRSFDLNVYRAGLRVEDLEDWISRIWKHFELFPGSDWTLRREPAGTVGHLAGGTDREGREFLSLYFGIRGHGPGKEGT